MAQANEFLLYQPDEKPSHQTSLLHGFQSVMDRMASVAAVTSIVAVSGGQSEGYLSWILFSTMAVCGFGMILQTIRVGRFGSGYAIGVTSNPAFIAISISALAGGGPKMLSTLIAAAALVQFLFISRLSLLRRIITPTVAGTVLMLLAATIISVVLGRLSDLPEGFSITAAPVLAGVTLLILLGMRLFTSAKLQQWAPIGSILAGCIIAVLWGIYDFKNVIETSWVGIPAFTWSGFDLSFGATFWALLPGFIMVFLAANINSISDIVVLQQVAWRRPSATDFRVVQGAHNVSALTNLLAAALGTLPNMISPASSTRVLITGVAACRVGLYGGLTLMAVAFFPKILALIIAIPRPILVAYLVFVLSLLFVEGMRTVFRDGIDGRKAAVVGVSLWVGIGFQNQVILPELLTGTLGTLLSNGMTTGSICVIVLTLVMELTSGRSQRLNVEMSLSSLQRIDAFLRAFAYRAGWNSASIDRLRSAG